MTSAEVWAAIAVMIPAGVIVLSYVLDAAGLALAPATMLIVAALVAAAAWRLLRPLADPRPVDSAFFGGIVGAMTAWLVWLAWPSLLPLSTGPDLTHHLLLVRYIEEHWRLVHDPSLERFLGEMAQYTPGSHILAALAGAWSGTDGLRALHTVQAIAVALKAGLVFLIARRLLPAHAPRSIAVIAVILPLAAPRYFLGAFTEYGFVAQVVAELFAVAMWWAVVAWDRSPDWRTCVVFTAAASAAFLTWPVYTGAPVLAATLVMLARTETPFSTRLRHYAVAIVPFGGVAAAYLAGRLGWLQLAGTGGAAPWPSLSEFSWPLVSLALIGLVASSRHRRGRATVLFAVSVLAEAAAFFAVAQRAHAPQPYMALKMFYLLLWPMAALATAAIGEAWTLMTPYVPRARWREAAALGLAGFVLVLAARPLVASPRRLHPLPPATSLPLYEAGKWARANLPAGCIDYLVADDETAYWLHLAVLGNRRMSARTGDNSTYEPNDAILRWLTPGGLPYAIADLPALPRGIRDELDVVRQFGTAAIVKRRGAASCDEMR